MKGAEVRREASYRKGLVLGLTMAELMLLMVFALLIALAGLWTNEKQALAEVEAELQSLNAEAAIAEAALSEADAMRTLVAERTGAAGDQQINDQWRRLVLGAATVEQLAAAGLDTTALVASAEAVKAALPLLAGRGAAALAEDLALAAAVRERLGAEATAGDAARLLEDYAARAERAEASAAALADQVASLDAALSARAGRRVDLPPIITLREEGGTTFETGSAALSPAFAEKIRSETAPDVAALVRDFDVDVIEVIGHTDERPVAQNRVSNLDRTLLDAVRGGPVDALVPADNAGLGLARAVAVAQMLKADPRLAGLDILPLSAAQLIDTSGRLTDGGAIGDVRERRRIEIRLRRSNARDAAPVAQ